MSARPTHAALLISLLLAGAPARADQGSVLDSPHAEVDAGREGAASVEQQIGTIDDPALTAYVQRIGDRLLRAVPQRRFAYRFRVVDDAEPNAFALPGGFIFVSRGLLALASSEAELACVLGHEIAHVVKRHAAAQQGATRGQALVSPFLRASRSAAYSRDLERTADHDGQILCAAAGYDPRGLATFLESLGRYERLRRGQPHEVDYFDTHPLSAERASAAFIEASQLRWKQDPSIGDPAAQLLEHIQGLAVGQRPESGLLLGSVFAHPDLGFKLRFPPRWRTTNRSNVVGAQAPQGDAIVYLAADARPGEPEQVAGAWAAKELPPQLRVRAAGPFRVGSAQAWQLELEDAQGARCYVTFVPHRSQVWRVTGVGRPGPNLERTLLTARSFRPLTEEDRAALRTTRLRLATAMPGEDLAGLLRRTQSVWSASEASVFNAGRAEGAPFSGGERVKIALAEPYASAGGSD